MSINQVLQAAEEGTHPACTSCPWNPKRVHDPAFGFSCAEHGIDTTAESSAKTMMVVRDPANTTPRITRKLCFVCNKVTSSDRTAQHAFALWCAGVACADNGPQSFRYLNTHYWTNAVMHGVASGKRLESARRCCRGVLFDQIASLSPRVIIASGVQAATSLHELGLLNTGWREFRTRLEFGAYTEHTVLSTGSITEVYCTYHTSATSVNCVVSKLYSDLTETALEAKRDTLGDTGAVDSFLARFRTTSAEGRGMRVLLLHWLDIGEAVRRAAAG